MNTSLKLGPSSFFALFENQENSFKSCLSPEEQEIHVLKEELLEKADSFSQKDRLKYLQEIHNTIREIENTLKKMKESPSSREDFLKFHNSAKKRLENIFETYSKNKDQFQRNKAASLNLFDELELSTTQTKNTPSLSYKTVSSQSVMDCITEGLEGKKPPTVILMPTRKVPNTHKLEDYGEKLKKAYTSEDPEGIRVLLIETTVAFGVSYTLGRLNVGRLVKTIFDTALPEGKKLLEENVKHSCKSLDDSDSIERFQTATEALGLYKLTERLEEVTEVVTKKITVEITEITEKMGLTQENITSLFKND